MEPSPSHSLFWTRVPPGAGHSTARVLREDGGWSAVASEVARDDEATGPVGCWFEVQVDDEWRTREVHVLAAAEERREIRLSVDGAGRWRVDGAVRADLDGCVDVDVSATPLTNTFPIRRLDDMAVGEATTLPVAWVEVPALVVHRLEQTYTRLERVGGHDAWRYADPRHGAFVLTVDDDGFVLDYEGLAVRL